MPFAVSGVSSWSNSSTPFRYHGLDALRGLAAVLVVLFHAGIPYMTNPLPYLVWPARDIHPSAVVDGLTWCTECFVMPLFFVLAGFFSKGLLVSRGERNFLTGRTKRLLSTQVAACLVILPACLGVWLLGWAGDGLFEPHKFMNGGLSKSLKAEIYGVGHLWFLQNLYIYCLALCSISWLTKRIGGRKQAETDCPRLLPLLDNLLVSAWKPLLPAIPCALILFYDTRVVLGFYQTFTPVVSKLAYYGIFFLVGVTLHRRRDELHLHARFGKTYLFVASLLFAFTLPLIHEHLAVNLTGLRLGLLASLLALFACFTTFGLFAIFLRTRHGDNAVMGYLAKASFWIYLIHLPFVTLSQIAIVQLPVPTEGKFLLAGMIALTLSLMTYHVFVRETWIGEFLDGRRRIQSPVMNALRPTYSRRPIVAPAMRMWDGRLTAYNRQRLGQ